MDIAVFILRQYTRIQNGHDLAYQAKQAQVKQTFCPVIHECFLCFWTVGIHFFMLKHFGSNFFKGRPSVDDDSKCIPLACHSHMDEMAARNAQASV